MLPGDWIEAELPLLEGRSLERRTQTNEIIVAQTIELDGDRLTWNMRSPRRGESWCKLKKPRVGPRGGVLDKFVSLAGKDSPHAVLKLAKEWGVFGICEEHNLPRSHNSTIATGRAGCQPRGSFEESYWEPVRSWFKFAQHFQSILNVAARLHLNKKGTKRDWINIKGDRDDFRKTVSEQRWLIGDQVNALLFVGGVRLSFSWPHHHPSMDYSTGGVENLFGYLALQLALAIGRTDGLATCSACAQSYIPGRQPNANRRTYCLACGRKAAVRDASREYRRRKKRSA